MSNPMILMEGVHFFYRGADNNTPILQDISLSIHPGEWVSIIGANGSGKSTLVKLFNGLLRATQGQISIEGTPLTNENLYDIRQQIGYVFQNPENQFIGTTVMEDMVFGLENLSLDHAEMERRVNHYAAKLNIVSLLSKHPAELSGGQKQRAALAAILAMEPRIVIFDEATSMLDEQSRQDVIQIIRDMHQSGSYTIISITHDADEIEASDRVLALADGQIIADAPPSSITRQPDVMRRCNLIPSFYIRLTQQLKMSYDVPVHHHADEHGLLEELCQLYSMK
ncbi:ATP-binding cassette domain-containing protein [Paenibacillus terrigena]|uniref:ATP-binding cassette domain-containing protein n=1 Tax=Paenibacillus terrigena TaxID=369333 RepID=UPI0003689E1E|nr:ATP-binding cassette domain-containing protein [Paenibacillus terrigena]